METTTYKPYFEKLKDPRWQRRRLEIMQAANFECHHCHAKDKTLNVHHCYYEKGRDPWDYEDDLLVCLCEDCHEETERINKDLCYLTGRGRFGNWKRLLWTLTHAILHREEQEGPDDETIRLAIAELFRSPYLMQHLFETSSEEPCYPPDAPQ